MATFRPSTKPASLRPWPSAEMRCEEGRSSDELLRNPTTGDAGCCARDANGHATVAPPSHAMNWRRLFNRLVGLASSVAGGEAERLHGSVARHKTPRRSLGQSLNLLNREGIRLAPRPPTSRPRICHGLRAQQRQSRHRTKCHGHDDSPRRRIRPLAAADHVDLPRAELPGTHLEKVTKPIEGIASAREPPGSHGSAS